MFEQNDKYSKLNIDFYIHPLQDYKINFLQK